MSARSQNLPVGTRRLQFPTRRTLATEDQMDAMVAWWVNGTGFFTPLHHIAPLWGAPDAMMRSMKAAALAGNNLNA